MGWVWQEEDDDGVNGSSLGQKSNQGDDSENPNFGDGCSTSKIMRSKCHTEETEPGKFVRKCHKTEEILKSCVGRPTEVVKSNMEYTEEDVTNEMTRGRSFPLSFSEDEPFSFPGLRSDIESLERSLFGGLRNFLEAADDMKNGFFGIFGAPDSYQEESPGPFRHGLPPPLRRGVPIEGPSEESVPKQKSDESVLSEFARQVRDV